MNYRKIILSIVITAFCFSGILILLYKNKGNNDVKKHQLWKSMSAEVDTWADAIGNPILIEPGIKDTVIVLNLLGFKTRGSCEGHIGWRCASPWVDFDVRDEVIQGLFKEEKEILKRIDIVEKKIIEKYPELSFDQVIKKLHTEKNREFLELNDQYYKIFQQREKLSREKILKLYNLIELFYKKNFTNYDRMLFLEGFINPRLQSLGAKWEILHTQDIKESKIKEYQDEMKKFTKFLINYFYSK